MIEWIKDGKHLQEIQGKHKEFLILAFYANFSSFAKRALAELENFSKENKELPVYVVDVEKAKGIHKQFEVKNIPAVLALRNGKEIRRIEGVESARFYARIFCQVSPSSHKADKKGVFHRVVVYSGPGCPACGTAKAYLRKQGVVFREIDISRDQHAAERLARRSGQMAVPQIDIDGHLIVGFDQARIDRLLK